MDGHVCENPSIAPAGGHLKRRRGRPRKDRGFTCEAYGLAPCKKGLASNTLSQVEPRPAVQHLSVGQPIGGVIEAVFDAGYLLKVKLSSGTTLRGVIFKPGNYVPFSDANDVAPNAQLVRRNDFSFPSGTQFLCRDTVPRGKIRRGQQSNGNVNGFPYAFNGGPADHLPVIAASPISTRCKFVPVVLPSSLSLPNGISPWSPALHMVPSISKQLSPFALEGPPFYNSSAPCDLNQIQPYLTPSNIHFAAAATTPNLSAIPFQQLLDEVIGRTQSPPSSKTHGLQETSDLEEPLSAEPLQAIQPNPDINRCHSDGRS